MVDGVLILDLSKIEAGKEELIMSAINIKELLEGSMVMTRERASKHQISLSLKIPTEIDEVEIQADERKVKQIIYNLLSNATKFTPDGGAITVEGRKTNGEVIISVSDTGIGIKPADQKIVSELLPNTWWYNRQNTGDRIRAGCIQTFNRDARRQAVGRERRRRKRKPLLFYLAYQ
ncbi:MAG: HAMP domain-containing sensor histidine kinase [Dehalococcoidales bacterium]|jgi:signal transduction histidine kinase|nr:HAMP domain-containing histidine kinase [Limnochordia bacterium]MDD4635827.1 HAMP domain-containing sensor histidine kinase [Dehalococcoidales bacterium]MDD5605547.1 HAMP domain-containing sensor histidine kinase [Dehalococcoidales bacterium]